MSDKLQNNQRFDTATFPRGMNRDVDPRFLQEGQYLSAINAVLNSHEGDLYKIGNEPSTIDCSKIPYAFNGAIRLKDDRHVIFSTNDVDSEIGILDDKLCSYTTLVNDPCLGFKVNYLIKGVAKENYDCSESVYWNNGLNPARTLNLSNIPYKVTRKASPDGSCDIEIPTDELDCEALRLSPLLDIPSLDTKQGTGGNLPNGVYRIAVAYSSKKIRITDYLSISAPQFIYHHTGSGGAIDLTVSGTDRDFDEYQIILIATINQQTTVRIVGYYTSQQQHIYIDTLKQDDETINLADVPLQSVYYEGGEAIYKAGPYLIQTAVRTRKEFNYQPQASKIKAKWVAYAVPEDYYKKGGNKIGYTKGEYLALAIRFVYNTGHRSSAFPLVGRQATGDDVSAVINKDSIAYGQGEKVRKFEIYDTATINQIYPDHSGEHLAMEGDFGYAENIETYPDNTEVWESNACKPILHFKWPDNSKVPNWDPKRKKLLVLGFKVQGITYPLDENGDPVEGVVGYEILRADKEGNKTIEAKGVIYNTGEYSIPTAVNTSQKGLYPNYPFNDLRTDPYLSQNLVKGGCQGKDYKAVGTFKRDIFTFHSPETHFSNPTLSSILKVEGEYTGTANGYFEPVYLHPKTKLIRDFAFFIAAVIGIGEGVLAITGKTTYQVYPTYTKVGATILGVSGEVYTPVPLVSSFINTTPIGNLISSLLKGRGSHGRTKESTPMDNIPGVLKIANAAVLFTFYFAQGTEKTLEIIKRLIPFQQYAYQCNSEGKYDNQLAVEEGNTIRSIEDYSYLYSSMQEFNGYRVNNRLRESSVILKLNSPLTNPKTADKSRQTIGTLKQWDNPTRAFSEPISAYYVSVRKKIKSIYGQIDSMRLVPTSSKIYPIKPGDKINSPDIFGGDTIIDEFTVKRKMSYFTQSAYSVSDGFEFDYRLYPNVPYARYWMDSHEYDISQFFRLSNIRLPNDQHYLDRKKSDCTSKASFVVKNGYFYLHNSGVARFFVESSYNLPFRENSTTRDDHKHYDKNFFTDLSTLFRTDIIKQDNYFSIDPTLSPIKQINLTYAEVQPRDYSLKDQKCFSYEPNKLIYSLPANQEFKRDNWRNFLVNNYYLFPKADGKISSIKEINRTGILYLFDSAPAKMHTGVDELQTDAGIKITIGDGGLFAREPQALSNTDFDHTECQSGASVVSTQYGVFFMSQRQGKIFNYAGKIEDISFGLKWWLAQYLPSQLLKDFPNFELIDNPVAGIGCLSIFDNTNETVYFSKKDFKLKDAFKGQVSYLGANQFKNNRTTFLLGDPRYFQDASWTISYDPKTKSWISYHDWHPDWLIQGKTHFLSFKDTRIWKHNEATDSYCTFYGIEYPWEVKFPYTNIQEVTSLESIEYYLECFRYKGNDRFHILEENFDRAIIYTSEQCTGLLKLFPRIHNSPVSILEYPKFTPTGVEIEVTKTEQKYRFNQFSDLTKNRGQFTLNWKTIFITEPNGYKESLNPSNLDYGKSPTERKKIRHNSCVLLLRKNKSTDTKMFLLLSNAKQIKSWR